MIRKLNDYGELMRIKMQMKESMHQYIHGTLALIAFAHFDAEARGLFFTWAWLMIRVSIESNMKQRRVHE